MNDFIFLLTSEYGIIPTSITPVRGGFSAKAYRVTDRDGIVYSLKAYDKSLPTVRPFVERNDHYMPVLGWLSASPALGGRVLTPVSTRNGAYQVQAGDDVLAVFLYVTGELPRVEGMTRAQTVELGEILAALHDTGASIPFDTPGLAEDISLSFCEQFIQFLDVMDAKNGALDDLLAPHAELLRAACREALRLRDTLQLSYTPLVLCHGDAHGNNVIQSDRLALADWEDLRWAPAEADLFIHAWHAHGDALLEGYCAARRGYRINRELLDFYTLRRRIEDVWVDIERLIKETSDESEVMKFFGWISQGIEEVRAVYRGQPTTIS